MKAARGDTLSTAWRFLADPSQSIGGRGGATPAAFARQPAGRGGGAVSVYGAPPRRQAENFVSGKFRRGKEMQQRARNESRVILLSLGQAQRVQISVLCTSGAAQGGTRLDTTARPL